LENHPGIGLAPYEFNRRAPPSSPRVADQDPSIALSSRRHGAAERSATGLADPPILRIGAGLTRQPAPAFQTGAVLSTIRAPALSRVVL
jgi:hypothetical protein